MTAYRPTILILFLSALFLCPVFSYAQVPPVYWQKSFGGTASDARTLVRSTSDGGCIIGGFSTSSNGDIPPNAGGQDIAIIKLDACGNKQWTTSFADTGGDLIYGLAEVPGGGYYFAGSTSSKNFPGFHGGSMDAIVGRLDASGKILWLKTFGGSSSEVLFGMMVLADASCVLAGWTSSPDGDAGVSGTVSNGWLLKLDKNGNKLWSKLYGGNRNVNFFDLDFSNDGGFVMTGHILPFGNTTDDDFVLVKTDGNGNAVWQKQFGGPMADFARTVRACKGGGYIAAGNTQSNGGDVNGLHGGTDAWIIRVDENGNLLWQKCIGGSLAEEVWEMTAMPNDQYLFSGGSYSNNGDISGNHGTQDALLIGMDGNGNLLWTKTYGGSGSETFFGINTAANGSVFLSGNSSSNDGDISGNHGSQDFIVFKLKNREVGRVDTSSCRELMVNNILVKRDTVFSAIVKDQCGYDSADVTYYVSISPGFVQSIPDTVIDAGQPIVLTTQASGAVAWVGSGLSCNNCTDPVVAPVVESKYIVSTAQGSCTYSDTVIVHIKGTDSLYIPTAFTPNGDGLNDVFKASGAVADFTMKVYNRWGQAVFQTSSLTRGWDGKFGNVLQSTGVYVFFVQYKNGAGRIIQRKGTVLLIR